MSDQDVPIAEAVVVGGPEAAGQGQMIPVYAQPLDAMPMARVRARIRRREVL